MSHFVFECNQTDIAGIFGEEIYAFFQRRVGNIVNKKIEIKKDLKIF